MIAPSFNQKHYRPALKRFLERKYSIRIPDADATPAAFDAVDKIAELVVRFRGVPA